MEISKLKQLIAFEKYKTLSSAAESLNISQPSLTRTMKSLEEEFGVELFERTKNSISLTETGKFAVDKARLLINEHDNMISDVRRFDESRQTISIGSVSPGPLWSLLPQFIGKYPGKTIRTEIKPEEILLSGLMNGNYDRIILTRDLKDNDDYKEKGIISTELSEEFLYAGLPSGHRLADRNSLKWKDIDGESAVIFSDTGMWGNVHKVSMPNSKIIIQSDRALLEEIVENSSLISFMSNLSMKYYEIPKGRVFVRIDEENARVKYYLHSLK